MKQSNKRQPNKRQASNREIKSTVFTTFFSDPENAAKLYTALEGVPAEPEDIEYTTLEGVLFLVRKNDMAFTVKNRVLVISEHQSTVNANMPLRDVIYYGRTMERLLEAVDIYRRKIIPIPTPEFYVFYNGNESYPSEKILKLSDSYIEKTNTPMLELLVKVININLPVGHDILKECQPLYEYSWFVQKVKEYTEQLSDRDAAIEQAIRDCIRAGIFQEFVRRHGSEAVNMLFTQFNLEDAKKIWQEEAYEDGEEAGIQKGIQKGIQQGIQKGIQKGIHQGEKLILIKQIQRKLQKGKAAELIAEELEEPLENIMQICAAIEERGLDADMRVIYDCLYTCQSTEENQ